MKISELASRSDTPLSAVKYYQREGLLPQGKKTAPNQTDYSKEHVQRVRLIRALLGAGGLTDRCNQAGDLDIGPRTTRGSLRGRAVCDEHLTTKRCRPLTRVTRAHHGTRPLTRLGFHGGQSRHQCRSPRSRWAADGWLHRTSRLTPVIRRCGSNGGQRRSSTTTQTVCTRANHGADGRGHRPRRSSLRRTKTHRTAGCHTREPS